MASRWFTGPQFAAKQSRMLPRNRPGIVESAVVEGRSRLALFTLSGRPEVPADRLTPQARARATSGDSSARQFAVAVRRDLAGLLIGTLPLAVLAASTAWGDPGDTPGWITWVWCAALCGINLIFLVIGPRLWNALITATIAIDDLGMSDHDSRKTAAWIRRHYISRALQGTLMLAGALTGVGLLRFIDWAGRLAIPIRALLERGGSRVAASVRSPQPCAPGRLRLWA